jgi:hypothetical protein
MPTLHLRDVPQTRWPIVMAFAELPDEAFNYLVELMWQVGVTSGGFRPDSRAALANLSHLSEVFLEAQQTPPP